MRNWLAASPWIVLLLLGIAAKVQSARETTKDDFNQKYPWCATAMQSQHLDHVHLAVDPATSKAGSFVTVVKTPGNVSQHQMHALKQMLQSGLLTPEAARAIVLPNGFDVEFKPLPQKSELPETDMDWYFEEEYGRPE